MFLWGILLFCVAQGEDIDTVMVKEFKVEANDEENEFKFQDCDMTYSGPTGERGVYRLRGTQTTTQSLHCIALYNRPLYSKRYKIEAKFRHETANVVNGLEYSHMGFVLKYKNTDNFVYIIVRYVMILRHRIEIYTDERLFC